MNNETKKYSPNLAVPGLLGLMSLAVMICGLFGESSLLGIGFVLFVTSIVVGVSWYGAGMSVMSSDKAVVTPAKVNKVA